MMKQDIYKGYYIIECDDESFDILELNGDLVDGEFKSFQECKDLIDGFDRIDDK